MCKTENVGTAGLELMGYLWRNNPEHLMEQTTPLSLRSNGSEVTLSGFAGGEYLPLPASEGLAFPLRSAEPFGLFSAMRARREFGRTLGPNWTQGQRLTSKPVHPRWVPHFSSGLRSRERECPRVPGTLGGKHRANEGIKSPLLFLPVFR